jgi:hypothetical protein
VLLEVESEADDTGSEFVGDGEREFMETAADPEGEAARKADAEKETGADEFLMTLLSLL